MKDFDGPADTKWRVKVRFEFEPGLDRQIVSAFLCNGVGVQNNCVVQFAIELVHNYEDNCHCEDNVSGPVDFRRFDEGHGVGFTWMYRRDKFIQQFIKRKTCMRIFIKKETTFAVNVSMKFLSKEELENSKYRVQLCEDAPDEKRVDLDEILRKVKQNENLDIEELLQLARAAENLDNLNLGRDHNEPSPPARRRAQRN